jgi:hypothetical protein
VVSIVLGALFGLWAITSAAWVRVVNVGTTRLTDVEVSCTDTGTRHAPLCFGDLDPGESELELVAYDSVLEVTSVRWGGAAGRSEELPRSSMGGVWVTSGCPLTIELDEAGVRSPR